MTKIVNIHEAKTHLSRLIDQVAAGSEVIIAKAGKPLAKLTPFTVQAQPKKHGLLKGKIKVPDGFNATDETIVADFEGR
jgi:prevent-host-death family protein